MDSSHLETQAVAMNHLFLGRAGSRALNIIYALLIEIKYQVQSLWELPCSHLNGAEVLLT